MGTGETGGTLYNCATSPMGTGGTLHNCATSPMGTGGTGQVGLYTTVLLVL